jgi:hypothetical protein
LSKPAPPPSSHRMGCRETRSRSGRLPRSPPGRVRPSLMAMAKVRVGESERERAKARSRVRLGHHRAGGCLIGKAAVGVEKDGVVLLEPCECQIGRPPLLPTHPPNANSAPWHQHIYLNLTQELEFPGVWAQVSWYFKLLCPGEERSQLLYSWLQVPIGQ